MAFLALAGVNFTQTNNGGVRPVQPAGRNLSDLAFAGSVTAPSANRHLRWDAGNARLEQGDTTQVDPADTPSYRMLVEAKAYLKEQYVRGMRTGGNDEMYHVFMTPSGMAKLRLDPDYLANVRNAGMRGKGNELFKGAAEVTSDGLMIHEHRHVYNVSRAAAGQQWGGAGDVNGQRTLICGAQALAWADLGMPMWIEDEFDYENQPGISIAKIMGMRKPVWRSSVSGTQEDFAVLAIDTAQ